MNQNQIVQIADRIRQDFNKRTSARDLALSQTRLLTRHCANAIRAIHRDEYDTAQENLQAARNLISQLKHDLIDYPDLFFAGYTQDALKEFAEANLVYALISNSDLPTPAELGLEASTYMQGIAEAIGELRRRCLDQLRQGHSEDADRLLGLMDDIFTELITMDYPDAITGGLRRLTDIARSILERTRGDLTLTFRQEKLESLLKQMEERLLGT
jgi:translin